MTNTSGDTSAVATGVSSLSPRTSSPSPSSPSTSERSGSFDSKLPLVHFALARAKDAAICSTRFARRAASLLSFFALASKRFCAFLPLAAGEVEKGDSTTGDSLFTGTRMGLLDDDPFSGDPKPSVKTPFPLPFGGDERGSLLIGCLPLLLVDALFGTGRANTLWPCAICPFGPNRLLPITMPCEELPLLYPLRPLRPLSDQPMKPVMYRSSSSRKSSSS